MKAQSSEEKKAPTRCPQCGYDWGSPQGQKQTGPSPRDIFDLWNRYAVKVPKATRLTNTRTGHIKARLKEEPDRNYWERLFSDLQKLSFYCGKNERRWKATFDWIIKNDTNHVKVSEASERIQNLDPIDETENELCLNHRAEEAFRNLSEPEKEKRIAKKIEQLQSDPRIKGRGWDKETFRSTAIAHVIDEITEMLDGDN